MKILCLCHANICRSFLAQEFFKKFLPQATIYSRGFYADPSYHVPQKVKQALAAHQLAYTHHTPTLLTPTDLQRADLIFCMQTEHENFLLDRYAQHTDKIWLLTEFAGEKPISIADPIALPDKAFAKQADRLYCLVEKAANRILASHAGGNLA